jgi:hypothetical protein
MDSSSDDIAERADLGGQRPTIRRMLRIPADFRGAEMFEAFAREPIERTRPDEGEAMYAYWRPYDFGPDIFQDTRADWPTMKGGFDEIIQTPIPAISTASDVCLHGGRCHNVQFDDPGTGR